VNHHPGTAGPNAGDPGRSIVTMKFSFLSKPKEATVPELQDQLGAAQDAHQAAQDAVTAAELALDEAPSDLALKALRKAREAETEAADLVAHCRRMLAAGEEREAAAEQERLRARLAELEADHARGREQTPGMVDAEAEAFVAVADARLRRRRHLEGLRELRAEMARVRLALGEPPADIPLRDLDVDPPLGPVASRLVEESRGLPTDDHRAGYLRDLARGLG
jgi:hypothetical protein